MTSRSFGLGWALLCLCSSPLVGQSVRRVSVDSDRFEGIGVSGSPSLSQRGRWVAFRSEASNLVANDTNQSPDVFVYDTHSEMTTRVSVDSDGNQASLGAELGVISGDGRYIAFHSFSDDLIDNDTNNAADVFVHDWSDRHDTVCQCGFFRSTRQCRQHDAGNVWRRSLDRFSEPSDKPGRR